MKDLFFFFGDQHKIGEKDASVRAMTFFFFGDHNKSGQKDEKIFSTDGGRLKSCGIFTLSSERSHYFRHFRRR